MQGNLRKITCSLQLFQKYWSSTIFLKKFSDNCILRTSIYNKKQKVPIILTFMNSKNW